MDHDFNTLASEQDIETTIQALTANGIRTLVVDTSQAAKDTVLSMIPKGAQVFTMSSVTLETTGIAQAMNESHQYDAVRPKLMSMDRNTQGREMTRLGSAPDVAIGSAHAVTQDGQLLIASNTGSQLAAYVYGAEKVIFVIGAQKIVRNLDDGMKRIYDYVLPLESERVKKAYGMEKSNVSKLLIIYKEIIPDRITVVIVKEQLGY